MKAELLENKDGIAKIKLELNRSEIEKELDDIYQQTKNEFSVRGFRKGKAPRKVLENLYGDLFLDNAIDSYLEENIKKIEQDLKIRSFEAEKVLKAESNEDNTVTAEFNLIVYPEVKLDNFEEYEFKAPKIEVTDEDLNTLIKEQLNEFPELSEKDVVEEGDSVLLDYSIYFLGNEEPVLLRQKENEEIRLDAEEIELDEAVIKELLGKKSGDEIEVEYEAKNGNEKFTGKILNVYDVKVKDELDEEAVKRISDFTSVEEYKDFLKEILNNEKQIIVEKEAGETLIKQLLEKSEAEFSEPLKEAIRSSLKESNYQYPLLYVLINGNPHEEEVSMETLAEDVITDMRNNMIFTEYLNKTDIENEDEFKDIFLRQERKVPIFVSMNFPPDMIAQVLANNAYKELIEKDLAKKYLVTD